MAGTNSRPERIKEIVNCEAAKRITEAKPKENEIDRK